MTISLKHLFQSSVPDGGDTTLVQPSNWNEEHVLEMATGKLLGRSTAGTGAAEEISVGTGLSLSGGTLSNTLDVTLTPGTTATSGGAAGQIMFDTGSVLQESSNLVWDNTAKRLTISGYSLTGTAADSLLDLSGTWNTTGTPTALKLNVTDTASNASSLLMDLQVGGSSRFSVRKDGRANVVDLNCPSGDLLVYRAGTISARFGTARFSAPSEIGLSNNNPSSPDIFLSRRGAANLRFGAADAAAPVAQTLSVQSVVAGTTNTAGANLTITGSQGTGTGAGGSIIFQVAPAGSSGTAQNALTSVLQISAANRVTAATGEFDNAGYLSLFTNTASAIARTVTNRTMLFNISNSVFNISGNGRIGFASNTAGSGDVGENSDTLLTRRGAANLRFGAADAAAPVAQTLSVQSVVAGTSNTAGANLTITGSQGTGTGAGGSIIFQTAPAGSSGTAQNALATAMTINSAGQVFAGAATGTVSFSNSAATTTGIGYRSSTLAIYQSGTDVIELSNGWRLGSGYTYQWTSNATADAASDTFIGRRGAANLRFGAADAAAPVAQTLSVQSVVAGTSNTAGADLTITGSQGTGNAAGGGIVFQTSQAGSSGTSQNAFKQILRLDGNVGYILFGNAATKPYFDTSSGNNRLTVAGYTNFTSPMCLGNTTWGISGSATDYTPDVILTRRGAANLQFGAADAAAPVAQTLSVQSVVAGTSNTAGANLTITGSQGTGTGAAGNIIFQTSSAAASTGTAQNALATVATIGPNTLTGSQAISLLDLAQTWNTSGTPSAIKLNVTDTASNASSLLMDLQVGGTNRFRVDKNGSVFGRRQTSNTWYFASDFGNGNFTGLAEGDANTVKFIVNNVATVQGMLQVRFAGSDYGISVGKMMGFGGTTAGSPDTWFGRKAAADLRFGAADAAAPVAQTLSVQSVVAGTSNTAGANLTITGSQGTGTGAGGDIIFQTALAGTSGTAQNSLITALRIYSNQTVAVGKAYTVATLPAAGTQGRRAWVTDATAPTFLGALTGGGAVVCPVFDNGTAWVAG